MAKSRLEENLNERNFRNLKSLIQQRQAFEDKHLYPPFSLHKTNFDFKDLEGKPLLHYAAAMGDLEKVKYCLTNNADINLLNDFKQSAILVALESGHFEVVDYLYEQGANCANLDLASCKGDKRLRQWLTKKIKSALEESFPLSSDSKYPLRSNQIFGNSFQSVDDVFGINKAIEIGEIPFILDVLKKNQFSQEKLSSLLIIAAKNDHLDVIQLLVANNATINNPKKFKTTALIEAIKAGNRDIINYLLELEIDVNQEDSLKNSALFYAVSMNNEEVMLQLLAKIALKNSVNINGNTVLHLAVMNNSVLLNKLLEIPGIQDLGKIKNIYGKTPLDLAIENKQDDVIKLLEPDSNIEFIKQSSKYGIKPAPIDQNEIMDKMLFRLKIKYRDTRYFSNEGHCNGFSFLKSFYAARGLEEYYFETLALMSRWDGNENSLANEFKDIPQAAFYKNLDELFEQWTNDVIWFQHSSLAGLDQLDQADRLEQYSTVTSEGLKNYSYRLLYKEHKFATNKFNKLITYERNSEQLTEILYYLMRMPVKARFEIEGDGHATSGYINNEKILVYYDPNFKFITEKTRDLGQSIQQIIDYKYILLNRFDGRARCNLRVYCFEKDLADMNLDVFEVFHEMELPKSKEEAQQFQKNSANHFSPIHVALMTRSLPTFKKLLTDGHCDVNAHDFLGRTALHIALESEFYEAAELLLLLPQINLEDIDGFITKAYRDKQVDIMNTIINSPNSKNLSNLLIAAIENEDFELIKTLLSNNKASINEPHLYQLPLIEAIEKMNIPIIQFLLSKGADILINNGKFIPDTPLKIAFSPHSDCSEVIISHLKEKDINQLDSTGQAAIHYAAYFANSEALKRLINAGANLKLSTEEGLTVFDLLKISWQFNQIELDVSFKLLVANYTFCLTDSDDKNLLTNLLIQSAESNDDELFKMVLTQCNPEIINSAKINYKPLLHHFMLSKQYDRIRPLLEKGAYVDSLFASGNTPLMGFIKIKDIPEKYELIPLFIEFKSDLTLKNKEGKTAIDLVTESNDDKIEQIFNDLDLIKHFKTDPKF
ncbi:MAG: ankyrin repeat domain-containing protein [Tatlockia sp.]|nr:ankyrin repeat domain-containing protein [Tatlockia sp.]